MCRVQLRVRWRAFQNTALKLYFFGQKPGRFKFETPWQMQRPVLFWREFEIPYGIFCQWYRRPFVADGATFDSAEQYMMYAKARAFGDLPSMARILRTKSPREQKALGRQVANFDQKTWDRLKFAVAVAGNYAKFSQNPDLASVLLHTAPRPLAEASPVDRIWGIGLAVSDPKAQDPGSWKGENLLGKALMEVRRRLTS
ncbi:MAG: NADAR family protein [Sulfobacillus sp.]